MSLVEQADLKYEVVVSSNNALITLYRDFWGDNAKLDFCHLFWGTCAMALILPVLIALLIAFSPVLLALCGLKEIERRQERRRMLQPPRVRKIKPAKPPKPHPKRDKLLGSIAQGGAVVVFKVQSAGSWVADRKTFWRRTSLVLQGCVVVIAGAFLLALLGLAAYGVKLLLTISLATWAFVGEILGYAVLVIALCILGVLLGAYGARRGYHERIGHYASRPAMSSFGLFKMAYRAVKTNTCPRIVIKEER